MSTQAKQVLYKYWGYQSFRPMQEEIIDSVLLGIDTLALLPTGGGKSVCFQVPALVRQGTCLVITPLIALMRDQVEQLHRRNIPAKALHTGMHYTEIESVLNNAVHGRLKFLYVSPERLMNRVFQQALYDIPVNLIAVDEAHCISQWGYDFRPPYLKIAEIRQILSDIPVLALTATATPEVVDDIQDKLRFKKRNVFKASFERTNLSYGVFRESDKTGKMLNLLKNETGTAIVYVRNRKKTRELSEILQKNNISATYYHAGLNANQRTTRQHDWSKNRVRIMVATNAFGMGIDKPDVRQVIHYNLPSDIESYFQEAGRAGRDGKPAKASLLFNDNDINLARKNLEDSFPEPDFIRNVYNALGNYFQLPEGSGKDVGFDFKIVDFVKTYDMPLLPTYNAIKFLEKEGYIAYDETAGRFSKIKITSDNETLYRFIVENPKYEVLVKEILRSYGGIFSDYVNINERQIAKRADEKIDKVFEKLAYLSKIKILSYVPIKTVPQIFYNVERLPKNYITLSKENYKNLKEAAAKRLDAFINFLTNDKECRSLQLLRYFGEHKNKRCGICDVCIKINNTELDSGRFEQIKNQLIELVSKEPKKVYELIPLLKDFEEDEVISTIEWLIDHKTFTRLKDERISCTGQLDFDF